MNDLQYAAPLVVDESGTAMRLERIAVSGGDTGYNELFIQELAFNHPECLPVAEIDRAYEGLIPVCMELDTPAGPMDALYVTPTGRLVILEAKLWRNPEARRKVVAQILDYAKEVSLWSYDDLQREVSKATGRKGNALYDIAAERHPGLSEPAFVDEVSRTLDRGRFLLLIVGDGVREGVGAITGFLESMGSLEFTFGLVELALHRMDGGATLVQPRVHARTTIINRQVIRIQDDRHFLEEDVEEQREDAELSELGQFYQTFWPEFLGDLRLDDASQPLPKPTRTGNVFLTMPPDKTSAWITVYFSQNQKQVGVFLTFARGNFGDMAYAALQEDRERIEEELGNAIEWDSDGSKHRIIVKAGFPDLRASDNRASIKQFLASSINSFVNVFRPRLERIAGDA